MNAILQKPFLTNSDIMLVLKCSASKASRIRRQIGETLKKQGKILMTNDVPTKCFLDFMCYCA